MAITKNTEPVMERLKRHAKERGGDILTSEYMGLNGQYDCCCKDGHQWSTSGHSLAEGAWCPLCNPSGPKPLGFVHDKLVAKIRERGGVLLSDGVFRCSNKVSIRCASGHEWNVRVGGILENHWCPACMRGGKAPKQARVITIKHLQIAANRRGGVCLTEVYTTIKAKYKFRCKEEHEFESSASNILHNKSWCPHCARQGVDVKQAEIKRRNTLQKTLHERLARYTESKGGRLVSKEYIDRHTKYQFRCKGKHLWEATADQVLHKREWCGECRKLAKELKLRGKERLKWCAAEHGGVMLSTEYVTMKDKYLFRCSEGHEWNMKGGALVYNNQWCQQCAKNAI